MTARTETLLIISHVPHYVYQGSLYAYSPYAREIEIWAELFPKVIIAAPLSTAKPGPECYKFARNNIVIRAVPDSGGMTMRSKVSQILRLPRITWMLCLAMSSADAIHVRCPGNLGLLGTLLAPLFSRRLIAKYAGQWRPFKDEPCTWQLQRRLLRSRWWQGPVTVYGADSRDPSHVVSFFTSMMTAEQVAHARAAAFRKQLKSPLGVIFVGRLSAAKNVNILLEAIAQLKSQGVAVHCTIVGSGPERRSLENLAAKLDLGSDVQFTGGLEFEDVLERFKDADVLVLASETEGWPKVVMEAMAFGLVCIVSDSGVVRQMLSDGRGIVLPARSSLAISEALAQVARAPRNYSEMQTKAADWACQYTTEGLRDSLATLLARHWGVPAGSNVL